MKKAWFFLLLIVVGIPVFAQITLNSNDLASPGDIVISASQFFQGGVPPTGGNQTYSFPENDTTFLDTSFFVPVNQTPFADSMPGANLAYRSGPAYIYYTKSPSAFSLRGLVFELPPIGGLNLPFTVMPLRFTPALTKLTFPAALGMNNRTTSTARFEFAYDTVLPIGRVSRVAIVATATDTSIIDGAGNAEFASGSYPCLRNTQALKLTFKIQIFLRVLIFPPSWVDLPANLLGGASLPVLYTKSVLFWGKNKDWPLASLTLDSVGNVESADYLKELLLLTSNRSLLSTQPSFRFETSPNPARDIVSFSAASELKKVSLFSTAGKKILEQSFEPGSSSVSIGNLENGIYITELENQKGLIARKKLIISR